METGKELKNVKCADVKGAFEVWAFHPWLGWMHFGTAHCPHQIDGAIQFLHDNTMATEVRWLSLN